MATSIEIYQAVKRGETSGDGWRMDPSAARVLAGMSPDASGEDTVFRRASFASTTLRLVARDRDGQVVMELEKA